LSRELELNKQNPHHCWWGFVTPGGPSRTWTADQRIRRIPCCL